MFIEGFHTEFEKNSQVWRYLDIDSSTWSDEQMIDVEWEDGGLSREYGNETGIEITSSANRPCVAVPEVME